MNGDEELEAAHALGRVRKKLFGRGSGGLSVSRYQLQETLGAGGEATVYAAYDPQLGRRVALKLLPSHASGGRTLHEARALSRIRHANVLTVFDAGEFDLENRGLGHGLFIVLELVEGHTFDGWLTAKPRSTSEILSVMLDVSRGLQAVHEAGLVHRDIKPRNILIGGDGRVLVADFGVSMDREAIDNTNVHTSGTPQYMAPEQRDGAISSPESDQWSYCATLCAALGGCPAGVDAGVTQAGRSDARAIPGHVRRVLRRGLQPNPHDRYPSMAALRRELDRSGVQRRRLGSAMVAGILACGVVAWADDPDCQSAQTLLAKAWTPARAADVREALSKANGPAELATEELDAFAESWVEARDVSCASSRAKSEDTRRAAGLQLACLDAGRGAMSTLVDVLLEGDVSLAADAPALIEALPSSQRCLVAPAHVPAPDAAEDREAAAALQRARLLQRHGKDLEIADILESLDPQQLPDRLAAQWYGNRAALRGRQGKSSESEADFSVALHHAEAAGDEESAVRILIDLTHLATHDASRLEDASRRLQQASLRAEAAQLGPELDAMLALTRSNLAIAQGDDETALQSLQALEQICVGGCGSSRDRLLAAGRIAHGGLLLERGDLDGATSVFLQHLDVVRRSDGRLANQAWLSQYNLSASATLAGDLDQAEAWLDDADASADASNWRIPYGRARLARAREDAEAYAKHLSEAEARLVEADARSTWSLTLDGAHAALDGLRGNHREAVEAYRRLHVAHVREFTAKHRRSTDVLEELAEHEAMLGDAASSLAHHQEVFSWRTQHLHPAHPLLARSRAGIGKALLQLDRAEEAVPHLEAARAAWGSGSGPATSFQLRVDLDLVRALLVGGRPNDALEIIEVALAAAGDIQGQSQRDIAALWLCQAQALAPADFAVARSSTQRGWELVEAPAGGPQPVCI